jgi:hypothetical protein
MIWLKPYITLSAAKIPSSAMWTKIDNHEIIFELRPGDTINTDPGNRDEEYIIQKIFVTNVRAIHANGLKKMKYFNAEELISGTWWVKR